MSRPLNVYQACSAVGFNYKFIIYKVSNTVGATELKSSNAFLQRHSPDPGWWLAYATICWPTESTLCNRPTSKADNVGYTAAPELWIALASSHNRRHKNPDEPASPTARASKAARIQVQGFCSGSSSVGVRSQST